DLLRPDLDEEEIKAAIGEIDEHGLVRRVRSAIPAQERQQVVNAETGDQERPLDIAESAGDALRKDLLTDRVKRPVVDVEVGRLSHLVHRGKPSSARMMQATS